mmetsp:Transcript_51846/g.155597  ORF Transcript_51846/g.155597 Transcript_51846/m.155597 type:complete len:221 (-) Transcript_51846:37-699(-)
MESTVVSIPSTTSAKGENPMPSRFALSARLMNICVVLESFPLVAKLTNPLLLLSLTGSSFRVFSFHSAATSGFPGIPNWAMKPSITRKNRIPFQNESPSSTNSRKRSAPRGDHEGWTANVKDPSVEWDSWTWNSTRTTESESSAAAAGSDDSGERRRRSADRSSAARGGIDDPLRRRRSACFCCRMLVLDWTVPRQGAMNVHIRRSRLQYVRCTLAWRMS